MSEENDAVEQAIWEETYGQYFDDEDDYSYYPDEDYHPDNGSPYAEGFEDGYQAGMDAAHAQSLILRLKTFMLRWWVNRRMRAYARDMDDIPF